MSATVYLIHFEQPFKHARHYLGSAKDVQKRVAKHRKGKGAKLLKHVTAAGIDWSVVRTWAEGGPKVGDSWKPSSREPSITLDSAQFVQKWLDFL